MGLHDPEKDAPIHAKQFNGGYMGGFPLCWNSPYQAPEFLATGIDEEVDCTDCLDWMYS